VHLTEVQLERQDFVDNAIHELLQGLNPSGKEIPWNIETIGSIRDTIQYWLVEYYNFTDEITFYPFVRE
jgi:hypothetical protein